jgi:hypothetical protein
MKLTEADVETMDLEAVQAELRAGAKPHDGVEGRRRRAALWSRLDKLIADRPAYEMLPDRYDDPLCRSGGPDAGDDIF